jgi:hypothetical protein
VEGEKGGYLVSTDEKLVVLFGSILNTNKIKSTIQGTVETPIQCIVDRKEVQVMADCLCCHWPRHFYHSNTKTQDSEC